MLEDRYGQLDAMVKHDCRAFQWRQDRLAVTILEEVSMLHLTR